MKKDRGRPVSVPRWWIDELRQAMEQVGTQADVAALMAGTDDRKAQAFQAAKTRLSRFLSGDFRTEETANELAEMFKLPPYSFTPTSRDEALAMEAARMRSSEIARAMALQQLLSQLESGETTLDEEIQRLKDRRGQGGGGGGRNIPVPPKPRRRRHRQG